MNYTEKNKPALKQFCEEISDYLYNEKHIILNDLINLITHFSNNKESVMKGVLEFKIHSKTRAENGTVTTLSDKIIFSNNGFIIKTFSEEDFFGERYTNNEFYIDEVESEELIPEYLQNALKSMKDIMKDNNGYFEIINNKFSIK